MSEYIPWIEKYRPKNFNDIVLDSTNRQLFEGILKINKLLLQLYISDAALFTTKWNTFVIKKCIDASYYVIM